MYFSSDERNFGHSMPHLESLEDRLYLTTLVGGDTFQFTVNPEDPVTYRITLTGDIIAEFTEIGLLSGEVSDLSGRLIGASDGGYIFGGETGEESIHLIGSLLEPDEAGYGELDNTFTMDAIASDDIESGARTFGLMFDEGLYLYEIDNTTGDATRVVNLSDAVDGGGDFIFPHDAQDVLQLDYSQGSLGADFSPAVMGQSPDGNNYLYFTLNVEDANGDDVCEIFRVDPYAAAPDTTVEDMGVLHAVQDDEVIRSIAWDEYEYPEVIGGVETGNMIEDAYLMAVIAIGDTSTVVRYAGDDVADPALNASEEASYLFTSDIVDPEDIVGIEFVFPNPDVVESVLYAIAGNQMYMLELDDTLGEVIVTSMGVLMDLDGPLSAADDPDADISVRGAAIQSLAWNPLMYNPYTGYLGALVATDNATDEYFIVDYSLRSPAVPQSTAYTNIFNIFIVHSSPDASISIAALDGDGVMQPYSGSAGEFLSALLVDPLDAPDIGQVLLGVTGTLVGYDGDPEETLILTVGAHADQLGNLPAMYFNDGSTPGQMQSGVIMTENILEIYGNGTLSQSQMQMNVDRVSALACSVGTDADGVQYMYVIDNDYVNAFGEVVYGSQIYRIDPSTGLIYLPEYETQGTYADANGNPVTVSGYFDAPVLYEDTNGNGSYDEDSDAPVFVIDMDYGDIDMDGDEKLYAIVSYGFTTPEDDAFASAFGEIDPVTGEFTHMFDLAEGGLAMAFSPGEASFDGMQSLFVSTMDGNLYEYDTHNYNSPADLAAYTDHGPIEARIQDADGNSYGTTTVILTSMDFEESGVLYGYDRDYGRFMDVAAVGSGSVNMITDHNTMTAPGTLRPMVGAISYDYITDNFLAVDNTMSYRNLIDAEDAALSYSYDEDGEPILDGNGDPILDDSDREFGSLYANSEGAVLMRFFGTETEDARPQMIDRILIGGIVAGKVDLAGSIDTFYAGWIITGDASGAMSTDNANNFNVDGDIRNLVTNYDAGFMNAGFDDFGALGWMYSSQLEINVGGKLGWFGALNGGHIRCLVNVLNQTPDGDLDNTNSGYLSEQHEVETLWPIYPGENPQQVRGMAFQNHYLMADSMLNDSYLTPQYLGSIRDGKAGFDDKVRVRGELMNFDGASNNDPVDFYAFSLMAGQTVTIQLVDLIGGTGSTPSYHIVVMDPDWIYDQEIDNSGLGLGQTGNIIATNFSDTDPNAVYGEPFKITADKAGIYRIAIVDALNVTGYIPYELRIDGIGDLAIGGVSAGDLASQTGVVMDMGSTPAISAEKGDIGAIVAGYSIQCLTSGQAWRQGGVSYSFYVANGDLRAVDSNSFDVPSPLAYGAMPHFYVPNGSIGGLRAYGLIGEFDPNSMWFMADLGGSIDNIYCGGNFWAEINAGGGLGTLHATWMNATIAAVVVNLNTDSTGRDGIIDYWGVVNDMGVVGIGGPQIDTGHGGNVRYMAVGGYAVQDIMFSESFPIYDDQGYVDSGTELSFIDDSGAIIHIEVESQYYDSIYGEFIGQSALRYRQYGIRSGGGVLMNVNAGGNLIINAASSGNNTVAEIGSIVIGGNLVDNTGAPADPNNYPAHQQAAVASTGREVILNLVTGELELEDSVGRDIYLLVEDFNQTDVDIYSITGTNFTSITNNTAGEIVNINAESIGTLYTEGTVGFARKGRQDQAVYQYNLISDVSPFSQLHDGVVISDNIPEASVDDTLYEAGIGSILNVISYGGVGNFDVSGHIGNISVNPEGTVDHSDQDSERFGPYDEYTMYRGIVGAVHAEGDIFYVNIGEGIAPSGTGEALQAGLFAYGTIHYVTNRGQGIGSDIYGDIMARDSIVTIELFNGSIINADICSIVDTQPQELSNFLYGWEWFGRGTPQDPELDNWGDIGDIIVHGEGSGIIGTRISSADLNSIDVDRGFGLFNSYIATFYGSHEIGTITADGFGIYNTYISSGSDVSHVIATGRGDALSTLDYSYSVRGSQDGEYDPIFGTRITELNDIHMILGTSASNDLSTSGMIANTQVQGQGRLGEARAYQIITSANTRELISQFDFINYIGRIRTLDDINGLEVTTGHLNSFLPGNDVYDLDMTVAGRINSVRIYGNLADSSSINAEGPNGYIKSVTIDGFMDGDIRATGWIGTIKIDGDFTGNIKADVTNSSRYSLAKLIVGGSFTQGSLDVNGSVGSIIILGDFGVDGDWLVINGDLGSLKVGTNKNVDGSIMNVDLAVEGNIGLIDVTGQLDSEIYAGGNLKKLIVRSDDVTDGNSIFNSQVDVRGSIGSVQVIGGSYSGTIVSGLSIGSFKVTGGDDLDMGGSVSSTLGDIGLVDVRNGDFAASVNAYNGSIKTIKINGDMAATASISAESLAKFDLTGSMEGGSSIVIEDDLLSFIVDGNVEAGAIIQATSGGKYTVGGDMAGSLDLGWATKSATIKINGDLTGGISVWSGAAVTVAGDMSGTLFVDANLDALNVKGLLSGNISVNQDAGKITLGSMDSGTLTVGGDAKTLTITGAMDNSLVQLGLSIGSDAEWSTADAYEVSRIASLGSFSAASMTNSILAVTGNVTKMKVIGSMASSSVSAGLNLGSAAIEAVEDDVTPLEDALELAAARSGADRELYAGDIISAKVGVGGLIASAITAGVDAGADGDFATAADNSVTSSLVGGQSMIKSLKADVNAGSVALADLGVIKHSGFAAGTVGSVDYDLTDIAPEAVAGNLKGAAIEGSDAEYITASGYRYTVSVVGSGTVRIYDEAGGDTDDIIDLLTIEGSNKKTRVYVTSNNAEGPQIGRVVTEDDSVVGTLSIEGDLVGDSTAAVDLWVDGDISSLIVGGIGGDGFTGAVGGDIKSMTVQEQLPGVLRIGGAVKNMEIISGNSNAVFGGAVSFPSDNVTLIAEDQNGALYAWDSVTNEVYYIANFAGRAEVVDALGNKLTLQAMDFGFAGGGALYGVAEMENLVPNMPLAEASGPNLDLVDLTVGPNGDLFTIASGFAGDSGTGDWLYQVDSITGEKTAIGALRDGYGNIFDGHVQALAYDSDSNRLLAIVSDQNGTSSGNAGAAIIEIDILDDVEDGYLRVSNPNGLGLAELIDAGGDAGNFTAMTIDDAGTIYAIRRIAGTDELVTIDPATGNIAASELVQYATLDTNIQGLSFDADDNLIAYNDDGVSAEMIKINMGDPDNSSLITVPGSLPSGMGGFAIGISGDDSTAYSYKVDGSATFYGSVGQTQSICQIDYETGVALMMPALLNSDSQLLDSTVTGLSIDNAVGGTGNLFVLTDDQSIIRYDIDNASIIDAVSNPIQSIYSAGYERNISDIDFNDVTGELIGLDANLGQFVTIDTATGQAVAKTLAGVVNTDSVTAFSMHAATDSVTILDSSAGEYLTSNNGFEMTLDGIEAVEINKLSVGDSDLPSSYSGRIASTNGDIKKVTIKNDFGGLVFADGDIGSVKISDSIFSGSIASTGTVNKISVSNSDILAGSTFSASEIKKLDVSGEFMGNVVADTAGTLSFRGDAAVDGPFTEADYASAYVSVSDMAGSINFSGDFYGEINVNEAKKIRVASLLDSASIEAESDVSAINVAGAVNLASQIISGTYIKSLVVGGVFSGLLSVQRGLGSAKIDTMLDAVVSIAQDTKTFVVREMTDSILSFGTWVGQDNIYNTADDVIVGGSVGKVSITYRMTDSVIAAGVLPNIDAASDARNMPTDNRAYIGMVGYDPQPQDMMVYDSAEAGGIMQSSIGKIIVRDVVNTSPNNGDLSVAVSADGIGSIKINTRGAILENRSYPDPYGPITLEDTVQITTEVLELYFSEEILTSSLPLSIDADGDGSLYGAADTLGSITVRDINGNVLGGITMQYESFLADDGTIKSVVTLTRLEGFASNMIVELSTDSLILDRSGLRSALRDFNGDGNLVDFEDTPGTVFDGDGDRVEGYLKNIVIIGEDTVPGNDHTYRPDLDTDSGIVTISSIFTPSDYDFYEIHVDQWEFFSAKLSSELSAIMVVCYMDETAVATATNADPVLGTQLAEYLYEDNDGTLGIWKVLARYETDSPDIYQAFEAPLTGTYGIFIGNLTNSTGAYSLELMRASSDDMLDGRDDNMIDIPEGEEIAYVSNEIDENNNELGANTPTQLVYLNFDGGTTTDYVNDGWHEYEVSAFDLADLNNLLDGYENEIINGDGAHGVTGIVQTMLDVYMNTVDGLGIDVSQISTLAEWEAVTSGIHFTLVDPAEWDADLEYTTIFIGEILSASSGLLGLASTIDVAGQDKVDNGIVVLQNFSYYEDYNYINGDVYELLDLYSHLIGTTAAHELGHTLGLNHQYRYSYDGYSNLYMMCDNLSDADELEIGLMSYPDRSVEPYVNAGLGTTFISSGEFDVGSIFIDTARLAYWWFA